MTLLLHSWAAVHAPNNGWLVPENGIIGAAFKRGEESWGDVQAFNGSIVKPEIESFIVWFLKIAEMCN